MINHHRITWSVYRARGSPGRDKKTRLFQGSSVLWKNADFQSTTRGRCNLQHYFVYLKHVPDSFEFRYSHECEGSILVLFSLASKGKIILKTTTKYLKNKTFSFKKKFFPINFRKYSMNLY